MKRFLALALTLLMVLSCFVACAKDDAPDSTETTAAPIPMQSIDLTAYKIVRPESASSTLVKAASTFKQTLDEKLSANIELTTDWVKRDEPIDPNNEKEILLGLTNRPASTEAQEKITGIGYVIALNGNKIVISATNDAALGDAVNYFVDTYVSSATGATVSMPENLLYLSEPLASLDIIKNGEALFKIVRAEECNQYMLEQAQSLRSSIEAYTGVAPALDTDWVKKGAEPDSSTYEILVGDVNRTETAQVKAELGVNQYTVRAVGNKIVLLGSSATGTGKAVAEFAKLISESVGQKVDGKADLTILASTSRGDVENDKWRTDIPAFTGGTYAGTLDANSQTYEALYTETTLAAFEEYCTALEAAGFTLYDKNEINGNVFRTYEKDKRTIVHTYFVAYMNAVRIVVSPYSNGLPPITSTASEKVTEPSVTQMILDYNTGTFGMCYIITNEDGSFIIFDGGGNSSAYDADRLHETLQSLNKRKGKPVIAAWILTHVHWDHHSNFHRFAQKYGSQYTLEYAIHNAPAKSYAYSDGFDTYFNNTYMTTINYFGSGTQVIKAHTGMRINLHGAEFEVLFSHEDMFPEVVEYFNNTCMATRMTLAGQTFVWMGDVQLEGSRVMTEMYGDYLKSDFLQMSHHGVSNGGHKNLYQKIKPTVALWPCKQSQYESCRAQNSPAGYLFSSGMAKEHIVADGQTRTLVLPYTPK